MRLVNDDVLPAELLQCRFLPDTQLVGGDEDIELLRKDNRVDLLSLECQSLL